MTQKQLEQIVLRLISHKGNAALKKKDLRGPRRLFDSVFHPILFVINSNQNNR